MKGHTKIELVDVYTGECEVHQDDNMVTNAIQMLLKPFGIFDNVSAIHNMTKYELWRKLLGGILLLDAEMEETADNILIPDTIGMTASGSLCTSDSSVPELGSYNAAESGIQENGSLKMVWDFSTSQGNGTIACACLTSAMCGYFGIGNPSGICKAGNVTIDETTAGWYSNGIPFSFDLISANNLASPNTGYNLQSIFMYADAIKNCLWMLDNATTIYDTTNAAKHFTQTGKINIKQYRLSISGLDLRQKVANIEELLLNTVTIDVPEDIKNFSTTKTIVRARIDEEFNTWILFANAATVAVNGVIKVLKLNTAMEISATYTVTNTTDISLGMFNNFSNLTQIYEGYLYTTQGNYLVKINITDSTDVSKVECIEDTALGTAPNGTKIIGKSVYIFTNNNYIYGRIVRGQFQPCNGRSEDAGKYHLVPVRGNPLFYAGLDKSSLFARKFCNYAATINNLEEPVVKTASKTMKVTYTLTFN